jgi:hypothetical protein
MTVETSVTETATEVQNPEDRFLTFLLLLGQQEDDPVDLPALQDALLTADVLRRCVTDGHMAGTERWSVLDVAAHIGLCTGKGRMPAERIRNGLMQAHAEFLRGAGSVRTSFCAHCDAPVPEAPELSPERKAAYERVLRVEPRLKAVVRVVDALIQFVRPTDELCHGCVWEVMVKPLTSPLIGWGRGYPPRQAKDPDPAETWPRFYRAADLMREGDPRIPATAETEKWLRSSEAWDAFTDVLIGRLYEADPANGCDIKRVTVDARALSRRT